MSSSTIGGDEEFYRDDLAKVSRLWLTDETTSYAIRTLTKLNLREQRSPPITTTALFFVCLGLTFFTVVYLVRGTVPLVLAWLLISMSLLLLMGSAWFAFIKKPIYLIEAVFLDGSVVKIARRKQQQALGMHSAINKAMLLQKGYDFGLADYSISQQTESSNQPDTVTAADLVRTQTAQKNRRMRRFMAMLPYSKDD